MLCSATPNISNNNEMESLLLLIKHSAVDKTMIS